MTSAKRSVFREDVLVDYICFGGPLEGKTLWRPFLAYRGPAGVHGACYEHTRGGQSHYYSPGWDGYRRTLTYVGSGSPPMRIDRGGKPEVEVLA